MDGLTFLALDGTVPAALSGPLPASWGRMTSLQQLFLEGLQGLTGTIPCEWNGMANLETLRMVGSGVQGCYPSSQLAAAGSGLFGNSIQGVRGE
jgi:hypothetical protein